ncbi:hypothetical protein E3T61_14385 [Cryobacterium lactosi]|uniref:Carboxylic ester hydrolase n=2 Tax=Cryobacterium lactosi TaxID=1259202 RepID=A0A4R9BLP3_9MICO|nr:hypothetical protein E3T61_14385 [Cryobacterium lactosi]
MPRLLRFWLPLIPLTAVALVLLWLNRSPWWGWALVGVMIVAAAAAARKWLRGHALLQAGAWLLTAVIVFTTAVFAYPSPTVREAGGADPQLTDVITTHDGPVRGVTNDDRSVEIFAGIPYAQPPVGDLRWRAPQPLTARTEVFTADRFSSAPVQGTSKFFTRALSQVVDMPLEDTFLNPYPVSEESLSLNIWRSSASTAAPRPVLVYIPGGGFATGSAALPLYDGEALASRGDVITVTLDYRLGVLGFLSHPDLAAESDYGASGNYGLLDQIAALQWIRDNIAGFGGDPDRVTIAGESAGGESVCTLGATPLAEGLVDGIIGGSGACLGTTGDTEAGDQFDTREAAEAAGQRVSTALGNASLQDMREMSVEQILAASDSLAGHWRPSVDGYVLEKAAAEIYASGEQLDVPTLVGSNADEASLALASPPQISVSEYQASVQQTYGNESERFLRLYPGDTEQQVLDSSLKAQTDSVMTRAMLRWAQLQTDTGTEDAYLYYFSHVPPDEGLEKFGAYHGAEVAYAYDNLGADNNSVYQKADYRLRDQMSGYWLNFVHTGNPNGAGLPAWPTVAQASDDVLEFGPDGSVVSPRPRPAAIDFWLHYNGPIR